MPILTNFLTEIADSIRERKGTTEPINAQDFATEISNLGAKYDIIRITANGTFDVEDYKNVEVEVISKADIHFQKMIDGTITDVVIPSGTTKIMPYSFYQRSKLTNVSFPEGLLEIGEYAFKECKFNDVILPKTLTTIGTNAFNKVPLTSLFIPKSLTNANGCFTATSSTTLNVTFEDGITKIIDSLFYLCSNIKDLTLPSTIKEIENKAFQQSALKTITLNDGLETIGEYALNNIKINSIVLPNTVTEIGGFCLASNTNLTDVHLSTSLNNLPTYCLAGCTSLKYIFIPSNIESIGTYAFMNCPITVYMEHVTPPTVETNSFTTDKLNRIYVPKGSKSLYISTSNWSTFADYIYEPNTITVNVPEALLNNEAYTYSIDEGEWAQFTSSQIVFNNISIIKFKNTESGTTIKIGTTSGGSDIGTIANAELVHGTESDEVIYLTIA